MRWRARRAAAWFEQCERCGCGDLQRDGQRGVRQSGEPKRELTVNQNVVVVSAPVSVTNCPGSSASFSVSATGTGLSYQWYKGGNALAGQTGSSLSLNNVSAADAGTYSVTVSGVCGSPVSQSASLTVNQNVVVVSAPVSLTNCPGTSASFSVNATGTGLGYQWYNGTNGLTGQTNSSLVLSNVAAADAGDLQRGGERGVRAGRDATARA